TSGDPTELVKKYEDVKKAPTVTKDDFKHLPKTERGTALRRALRKDKRARQAEREKLREALGDAAPAKEVPKTIESTREYDVTMVQDDDEETTWKFCFELQKCIPNAEIFSRKGVPLKKVVKQSISRSYTDLIVVHEDQKKPNGIIFCHLPEGPTAYFKINSLRFTKDIPRAGESSSHYPEIILNNFNTRLGHTYEFKKEGEKAALKELGPRFTLRLKWLQKGTFDTKWGEFEWVLKRHEMETSRRRQRFAWGEDALGPHVPVGGKMGNQENPELHTWDGEYRGTPSKGDKLIPDFFYRTPTMGTTYIDRCVTYFISALLCGWVTYHMYYHSGHLFGHFYMPYLYEFSDEELGIPPDDAPDPEYWGNHGKKYGTYR
ncbi:hypothetical protein OESDEN_15206, partial [Oesophagostomum dentatum]